MVRDWWTLLVALAAIQATAAQPVGLLGLLEAGTSFSRPSRDLRAEVLSMEALWGWLPSSSGFRAPAQPWCTSVNAMSCSVCRGHSAFARSKLDICTLAALTQHSCSCAATAAGSNLHPGADLTRPTANIAITSRFSPFSCCFCMHTSRQCPVTRPKPSLQLSWPA